MKVVQRIRVSETFDVLLRRRCRCRSLPFAPVLFEMRSAGAGGRAVVHVPPLPVTVKPPRCLYCPEVMPFVAPTPFDVMLRKVRPLAPMVVPVTIERRAGRRRQRVDDGRVVLRGVDDSAIGRGKGGIRAGANDSARP